MRMLLEKIEVDQKDEKLIFRYPPIGMLWLGVTVTRRLEVASASDGVAVIEMTE